MRVSRVADGTPVARAGLKTGDLLLEVNAEPFFRDHGGVEGLRQWLMRELRGEPQELRLLVWRDGRTQTLTGRIGLGPYAASSPAAP
jgi:S1-C subfamily serine protease